MCNFILITGGRVKKGFVLQIPSHSPLKGTWRQELKSGTWRQEMKSGTWKWNWNQEPRSRNSSQEPGGRNWSRSHKGTQFTGLLFMAHSVCFLLSDPEHRGLGPPPSIINQGYGPQTCLQANSGRSQPEGKWTSLRPTAFCLEKSL